MSFINILIIISILGLNILSSPGMYIYNVFKSVYQTHSLCFCFACFALPFLYYPFALRLALFVFPPGWLLLLDLITPAAAIVPVVS
jgi:hypothetical protein